VVPNKATTVSLTLEGAINAYMGSFSCYLAENGIALNGLITGAVMTEQDHGSEET
jgi:hypothetical protein